MAKRLAMTLAIVLLNGCAVGPDLCEACTEYGSASARHDAVTGRRTAYYDEHTATIIKDGEIFALYFFAENQIIIFEPTCLRYRSSQWVAVGKTNCESFNYPDQRKGCRENDESATPFQPTGKP